ncbi:extensin-like domain-containing protein [Paracoccus spongiarum]|uniref:Extensin family protein n=1 Tax=Paracoccus spongiarum TaxID=3064387 RepID=A0ABT9JBJ2_9RHOB|nr:extensin family protein [Paracoccus sp. 2205BS29-5]MDP5307139.1 extensin family protein [Paracoccus sp. 2205BS29-5]
MIGAAVRSAALLAALSGPAVAQDRPPAPPAGAIEEPAAVRPPQRPERPAPAPTAAPRAEDRGPDDGAPDRAAADEVPVEAAEAAPDAAFGPPMAPRWWMLRETEAEDAGCRLALALLGTVYQDRQPVTDADQRDCGIARPIEVSQIIPGLALEGGAVMRCDTARSLGFWARDFLRPAAATLPGAPRVTGLRLGTTYDCRGRVGTGADVPKLSEHAYGNAIDIAAFQMDNGQDLVVTPREDSGDRAEAFQRAVRGAACLYFTTVLGPGANAAHAEHLHMDMAARRNGWRLCQ